MNTHMLVRHSDIQNWVSDHAGQPALGRSPDRTGAMRPRLALNFPQRTKPVRTPSQDDGIAPCSWTAWLAELDRQGLALKVSDREQPDFEFVARRDLN